MTVLTFLAVVAIAAAVFVWVAQAQATYMSLRATQLGEMPPLADPTIRKELLARPWLWPLRAGSIWREQTTYDETLHQNGDLMRARMSLERRQRVAVVVYVLGVVAILLSTFVRL